MKFSINVGRLGVGLHAYYLWSTVKVQLFFSDSDTTLGTNAWDVQIVFQYTYGQIDGSH